MDKNIARIFLTQLSIVIQNNLMHAENKKRSFGIIKSLAEAIEEKDMNSILEPFFTNKEKGTGLGLAIVSRIVDGYGGRMKIKSRVGRGTQATVWLPSGQA